MMFISSESKSRPLIADSFPRKINIDHSFKGMNILVYGARNGVGNIIIIVRGPENNYILRKKGKLAGIWTNMEEVDLKGFDNFYSVAAATDIENLDDNNLFKSLEVGKSNLQIVVESDELSEQEKKQFQKASLKLMKEKGLYSSQTTEINFWGETLFRAFIRFPENINRGVYNIDVYLFNDGFLSSFQSLPIIVEKVGFEAFIHDLAHSNSLIYGLLCVLVAIAFGWGVGAIFARN